MDWLPSLANGFINEPVNADLTNPNWSQQLREKIANLTSDDANQVCEFYDQHSHIPLWDAQNVMDRAKVYLRRTYLLTRQMGVSNEHNTAFLVEGSAIVVIPINDLIDRINLFAPIAALIETLKILLDPKDQDCVCALSLLKEEDFLAESKAKFSSFLAEMEMLIRLTETGHMKLFLLVVDKLQCVEEAIAKLKTLTQSLIDAKQQVCEADPQDHQGVLNLVEITNPLLSVFKDIAECIRTLGKDAFDANYTDMVNSDNCNMINGFYDAMLQLREEN